MGARIGKDNRERLWTLAFTVLCLSNLFVCLSQKMVNVTVALQIDRLGGTAATVGISGMIFSGASVAARILSGRLSDRLGAGFLVSAGGLVYAVASALFVLAASAGQILFLRVFQGLGYAAAATALTVAAANAAPESRMGEGMGYLGLAMALSGTVGPPIIMPIYRSGHYNLVQYVIAFFGLLAFAGGFFCKGKGREASAGSREKFSLRSIIEPAAVRPGLITFFAYLGISVFYVYISIYAEKRGFSHAALFFTISAVMTFAVRLFCGRLYDRFGPLSVLLPGIALGTVNLILLAMARSEGMFLLCGVLYGVFGGALIPSLNSLAAQSVPKEKRGGAIGTYYVLMDVGLAVGSVLWGEIAEHSSYSAAFLAAAATMAISGVLALLFCRKRPEIA